MEKGDALIVDTGWGRMWNEPGCVDTCPNFRKSALRRVLDRNISIFVVDVSCNEASWADGAEEKKGERSYAFRSQAPFANRLFDFILLSFTCVTYMM
jgi:hypothetical protein